MKVILEHISKANLEKEPIELIVEELDRLGRNADLIKKELMWFKEHNIIVFVIPFASLKAQTSYEKCCAPPLFDL